MSHDEFEGYELAKGQVSAGGQDFQWVLCSSAGVQHNRQGSCAIGTVGKKWKQNCAPVRPGVWLPGGRRWRCSRWWVSASAQPRTCALRTRLDYG